MASLGPPSSFAGADILSTRQMSREAVETVIALARCMQTIVDSRSGCSLLHHKVLANVFYEPSTRTSSSFAAAMQRLGGSVLQISESTSSAVKGETLADSIRALACYADAVVLRHPVMGSAAEAAAATHVPVLNAGDGVGEHPTQALLDAVTIAAELGGLDGLTVTLVGDLKNGRTVHSLARVLALFRPAAINMVSPAALSMPAHVVEELTAAGVTVNAGEDVAPFLSTSDVLYVTRVQKERFADAEEYERLKHAYVITKATMAAAKERMVVMHPLPRVGEIAEEVDADPRAAYFRQMRYGLFTRMVLLALVMGVPAERIQEEAAR